MKTKEILISSAIALVLAVVVTFTGFTLQKDIDIDAITQEAASLVDVPDILRGDTGLVGAQGLIGLTGLVGDDGADGVDGLNGSDGQNGADAVIDIDEITTAVLNEIAHRDNLADYSFSGATGNFDRSLTIDANGTFTFTLKHFGTGDFVVTYEDVDANLFGLVDTSGHSIEISTVSLDEGVYTLHISADSDWFIEIVQI